MGSTWGRVFQVGTFGESHGGAIGVIVDGCPPRLEIAPEDIQRDLDRRRPGQSRLTSTRSETDEVRILSGVFEGVTLGTPIGMLIPNSDARPEAYEHLREVYRPSHADYVTEAKYGIRNWQGGGRASARETAARVAAGAVARKLLEVAAGVEVLAWVSQIHEIEADVDRDSVTLAEVEDTPTRCPDPAAAARMINAVEEARRNGESLGGVVECVARGVPKGLGDPVFDKLDADLAKAMLSLPAAKGVEVGSGFASVRMTGTEHNDPFVPGPDGQPRTSANRSGGIQGGISNGEDIVLRTAFKPTSTVSSPQDTVDVEGKPVKLQARGRHDPCVLPRAVPVVEAMVCLTLADHWLRQKAVSALSHLD